MKRMAPGARLALALALTLPALNGGGVGAQSPPLDRTSLPIPEPDYPRSTVLDARDAKAPPRFEIKAPAGAPNVLIVLVPVRACVTTSSTPRPCARPRGRPSSPAATTT
jgi:hypothetical protein